jgi:hypothetical protein
MIRTKTLGAAITAAALLAAPFAAAEDDADAAIKYRKDVMSAVGGHTKALVAILKGEISQKDALALHADGLLAATRTGLTIEASARTQSAKDPRRPPPRRRSGTTSHASSSPCRRLKSRPSGSRKPPPQAS